MKLRKSVPGLLIWALYIVILSAAAGQYLLQFSDKFSVMFGAVPAAGIALLIILKLLSGRLRGKQFLKGSSRYILESLSLIAILTVAVLLRAGYAAAAFNAAQENEFFMAALIGEQRPDNMSVDFGTGLYLPFLSFVMALFGNKLSVCIYAQIFLQMITLIFIYYIVRKQNGRGAAMFTLLLAAVSTTLINSSIQADPSVLVLCLFMLVFWLITASAGLYGSEMPFRWFYAAVPFVLGMLTVPIVLADLSGLVLPLILLAVIFLAGNRTGGIRKWIQAGWALFGMLCGVALLVCITAYRLNSRADIIVSAYMQDFLNHTGFHYPSIFPQIWPQAVLLLLITAGVWSVKMWMADRDEVLLYILILAAAITANLFQSGKVNEQVMLIAWFMAAAAGAKSFFTVYSAGAGQPVNVKKIPELVWDISAIPKMEIFHLPPVPDKPPVRLIDNPLPLPKKHVRKEMDYAFEPDEKQMHYDINELTENDDYDLK